MIRWYVCPLVFDAAAGGYVDKLTQYLTPPFATALVCTSPGGTYKRTWALMLVRANDFTAADADAQCISLLESRLDAIATMADMWAALGTTTVGSLPSPMRTRVRNRITALGLDSSWIVNSTTLLAVLQYVHADHSGADVRGMNV